MNLTEAKVALVFDWMTTPGGAEKVNLMLHKMFKDAPIFTSIFNADKFPEFEKANINTSFIQKLPFAKNSHQLYLSMMPYAYELFDLSDFDIVISSSHSCAKGIITKPETLHICYCHTPMRYAWDDWHTYIRDYKMNPIFKKIGKRRIHKIRIWDRLSADRVDHFIANSTTTQKRIRKYYKRNSTVIHPMIKTANYEIAPKHKNYYLAVGRLTPYKKFDIIVETFNKMGLPLKIVGTGRMENQLRHQANENIEFLGYVNEKHLQILYSECEALIFPQLEDFGITPVEAMASGRPVIAYKEGGALDSVVEGKTGIFFAKQDVPHLRQAIQEYEKIKRQFKPQSIQEHAAQFDEKEFRKKFMDFLRDKWKEYQASMQ